MEIDLKKLTDCFPSKDVEWRLSQAGKKQGGGVWAKCLAYITNRAIMQRLDDVCGPENWTNEFQPGPNGGTLCGISIRIGGEWITKWDGADNTKVESVKGGISDSMKRAGVQWGIGRYLYGLDETWAIVGDDGENYSRLGEKDKYESFKWSPPALPDWATPEGDTPPRANGKPKTNGKPRNHVAEFKKRIADAIKNCDEGLIELVAEFQGSKDIGNDDKNDLRNHMKILVGQEVMHRDGTLDAFEGYIAKVSAKLFSSSEQTKLSGVFERRREDLMKQPA